MIHTWQIFVDDRFRATVRSMTEQGAIDFWFMHFGSASKYTGVGRDQIKAIQVYDQAEDSTQKACDRPGRS